MSLPKCGVCAHARAYLTAKDKRNARSHTKNAHRRKKLSEVRSEKGFCCSPALAGTAFVASCAPMRSPRVYTVLNPLYTQFSTTSYVRNQLTYPWRSVYDASNGYSFPFQFAALLLSFSLPSWRSFSSASHEKYQVSKTQ